MALQGTLRDFALPDILQLISIQRKTGILTMESAEDTVTVQFFQGQVVGADTRRRALEESLGSVLVRTGKISAPQLQDALAAQRRTLQRLGYVLVKSGAISQDDLRDALRTQICQILYRLFRWRDGTYHFAPKDHLEYDRELTIPVAAETLLMEAARMIDEWPIIEKRIPHDRIQFRRTAKGKNAAESGEAAPEDAEILRCLDGQTTVHELVDRSAAGEFDVYRTLLELLQRGWIEEKSSREGSRGAQRAASRTLLQRTALVFLAGCALYALATLRSNPLVPWRLAAVRRQSDDLRSYASRGRIERVEQAVQMFYLDTGSVPEDLEVLALGGYLESRDLLDPWGRPFAFRRAPDGYRLSGRDPGDEPDSSLTIVHRFSPSQRMVLEGTAYVGSATRPDRP